MLLIAAGLGVRALLRPTAVERDANTLVARSDATLRAGNVSGARGLARQAVAADVSSAPAHLAAARAALAEGDGLTAEAEIGRAVDAGTPRATTRAMSAHARLLQNDATGALAIAQTAPDADRSYARRIEALALAANGDIAGAQMVWNRALAQAPDDAALWSDIARFSLAQGDLGRARLAADRAVALDPARVDALLARARVARLRVGLVTALPWQRRALARDPNSYAALIDHAATLGDVGQGRAMLATTRRALAVRPGDPQAFYLLATLAARTGKFTLARALFDRVGGGFDRTPGALLLGAMLDIDGGDNEQAVARLRNLIGLQPMNIRARQLLGVALLRLDAAQEALATLRPVALRDDADSYTLIVSARAFEHTGDRATAAGLLDRAATLGAGPARQFAAEDSIAITAAAATAGDVTTTVPLLRALLDERQTQTAVTVAAPLVRLSAMRPAAWLAYGDAQYLAGRRSAAAGAYRRGAALRLDAPAMLRLAATDDVRSTLDHYRAANPADPTGWRLAALSALARQDPAAARGPLERLRTLSDGGDAAVLAALALVYDGEQAVATGAAAYRLAPASALTCDAYGWALLRAGDRTRAGQLLRKAAILAPTNPQVRWHLSQLRA
ncbi:tetratricopeptide repeat protein [Sphingomonas sp. Leaf33]|uniref:tetratricopeptide repeat protein n=1 Tax=Sphingomonas sp. Leaf33 TaxID=1736215 RepID=UPI00138F6505|nr:tetratricopeptide repeat protein [Sphingomonas sp. Leaf33]